MATQRTANDVTERLDVDEVLMRGGGKSDGEGATPSTDLDDLDALLVFSVITTSSAEKGSGTVSANLSLTEKDKFAITCSKKLMRSWVNQPSPCCAAASVAGALNALSTKDPDWTCAQLLEHYKVMTRDRIRRQKRLVQLQAGVSEQEIADLEAAVREHVASSGEFEFGGAKKITRKHLLDAALSCAKESPSQYPVFHSLLVQSDADSFESKGLTTGSENDEGGRDRARENETKSTNTVFEIDFKTGSPNSSFTKQHRGKQHLQDSLYQYLHLIDGLAKLERPVKPSTAICGNEALLRAIDAVNASESEMERLGATGRSLHAMLFMGKSASSSSNNNSNSNSVTWQISSEDSEERRTDAWVGLWRKFSRDSTVLIYHLKNHYALVFAMREWQELSSSTKEESSPPENLQCREILTARKGQRPSAWVAWDEVYETLCSWHGYKIISISIERGLGYSQFSKRHKTTTADAKNERWELPG